MKKKLNLTETVFKTQEGFELSNQLIAHILKTENFQNYDEIINELRCRLCMESDARAKAPISSFLMAEDINRLKQQIKSRHYITRVNPVDN